MRAYLHRAFYDNMISSNNTNSRNTVDSNRCLDANSFENNNDRNNNRYSSRNRSQHYFRSLWSTTDHAESNNSNISVNNFWNRTNRNRSTNSNNDNNNGESTLARRVPVALSSHHYSMPYPAALPYPSETIYTEPVNATAILDGSYSLQFPGMFEMVDPCVEAYMASIQDNIEKERMKGDSRANNESTKGVCVENNNNATTLSLVSEGEQTSNNNSCNNSNCVNDKSNIDSVSNNVNNNNMREVSIHFNERVNGDHINEEAAVNITRNMNTDNNNNDINSINSSNQESNASLFSSFRQQTNIFNCGNEDTRSLETENVSHAQRTMVSNNSNSNNIINNNGSCNNDDGSNNTTDQSILSVIINEPASMENRCKGKSKRHLLSRLFGSCKVKNNEGLKRNDRRRCVYNYDNPIRRQSSVSSSLTSLESFEEEAPTTVTDAEREAARNTETLRYADNECQEEEEEYEQTDRGDNDNHHNDNNSNQESDNASVNSVNANTIPSSQHVAQYDSTNNNYTTNLHTCESYKVNVLEGGYVIFTDDFVHMHPASLIATITHAYKLTSPTTHLTSKTKEQMSRSRSRHWQYHANTSSNTNTNRHTINYNTTSSNNSSRDTTRYDVWDNEVDSALLNYDLVQQIHEIRKCVREAQLQHRPLFRLRSADAVYGSARYVQITNNK